MDRSAHAVLRVCLLLGLPLACGPALAAQVPDTTGHGWYAFRAGLLRLHAVDEAASPLRYAGTERRLELRVGRAGATGRWEAALVLRRAALTRTTAGTGAADARRIAVEGGWTRRVLGSAGSALALQVGAGAQAWATLRDQKYAGETRQFPGWLLDIGPRAALAHTRARDAVAATLELPLLAYGRQAYGAEVEAPWRLDAAGRGLRAGRLSLDWWHDLGPRWRGQIGCRAEALRLGETPVLAETARGIVVGLAYHPGRQP